METALYLLASTIRILLQVLYFSMFLRAILSWFVMDDNPVVAVLTVLTEPIIVPVRLFLQRFRFVRECPIDLSFLAAFLLLSAVQSALPVVSL